MPIEKMEPFKFRIRPSTREAAQRIADHRGDTLSQILRDAVKDYIRTHEHELSTEEPPNA